MGKMSAAGVIALALLAATAMTASAQTTLILRSGEHYDLKGPAQIRKGMVTFTTTDGRFLSVKKADIAQEVKTEPKSTRRALDGTDKRELGEIARENRQEKGVSAPVDPKKAPPETKSEKHGKPRKKAAPKAGTRAPENKNKRDNAGAVSDQSP